MAGVPQRGADFKQDRDTGQDIPARLDGLRPKTDHRSKMVMLAGERGDVVNMNTVIEQQKGEQIPEEVTIIERTSTYHGPKLLAHTEINGEDANFLITAPGPANDLVVWAAETDEENYRSSWYSIGEVEAELAEDQPNYEVCSGCKNPIRSIEHERRSDLGMCD